MPSVGRALTVSIEFGDLEITCQVVGETYNPTIMSDLRDHAMRTFNDAVALVFDTDLLEDEEAVILSTLAEDDGAEG